MATLLMNVENGEVPGATPEEKASVLNYWYQFNLDRYYPLIEEHTFPTVFVDFSSEEASSWLLYARNIPDSQLKESDRTNMANLKNRLKDAINQVSIDNNNNKVFLKLSTRSPKDAVDKVPDILLPILKRHLDQEDNNLNGNIIALRRAFLEVTAVSTVDEAFHLLFMSSRIISDIKRAIEHQHEIEWNLQFVVRQFRLIPVEGECRGFVHKKQLNALSQYYSECYFPNLVKEKDAIGKRILEFHERIKDQIPMESYIIDFAVLDDKEIKIVELNPFGEHTGAGLFSWKDDRKIIEEGPFDFRVRESPQNDQTLTALLSIWKHLIEQARKRDKSEVNTSAKSNKKNGSCIIS